VCVLGWVGRGLEAIGRSGGRGFKNVFDGMEIQSDVPENRRSRTCFDWS